MLDAPPSLQRDSFLTSYHCDHGTLRGGGVVGRCDWGHAQSEDDGSCSAAANAMRSVVLHVGGFGGS